VTAADELEQIRPAPLHFAVAVAAWHELEQLLGRHEAAVRVRERIGHPRTARRRVSELFDFAEADEGDDLAEAAAGLARE